MWKRTEEKRFEIKVKGWREGVQVKEDEKFESQLMLLLGLLELE